MAHKLSHKQLIERAHISLMRNKDFVWLAPVCLVGKVEIRNDIPTAGTNGKDVLYGTEFLDKCNEAQVRATVVHENYHKAMLHLSRHEYLVRHYATKFGLQQARMLVNMAQDFVINREIKKHKPYLECWDGIIEYCYDPKYDNDSEWDTERIAADLASQAKSGGQGGGGGGGDGSGQFKGGQDDHDWEGAEKLDEAEAKELGRQIEQALRQGQALSKKMSGNMPRSVGDLLEPAVDWRQALRDFVQERAKGGDLATYARPNRRYVGHNFYMPSTYSEKVKSVLFAVDTSGSVGPEELREVLTELHGCIQTVNPEKVDIIYWGSSVARHEHYEGEDADAILRSSKPADGGGTSPSCVVPFCHERNIKPTVVIWLSDGLVGGDWAEDLGAPALWVITAGGAVPPHLPHIQLPSRQ